MTSYESLAVRKGMECLVNNLTALEAELFISALLQGAINYTDLRQKYFETAYCDSEKDQLHAFIESAARHDTRGRSTGI
ncbi:hypothetical protein FACS1894184_20130 [Clostridia bacterium]|nr:hypothetical protein FACS1894184_20130 [Clostridia bacterium]